MNAYELVLATIEACPLRSNDHDDATYIKQHLVDIHADLMRMVHVIKHVKTKPCIQSYFQARQNFVLKQSKIEILSAHRKVRSDSTATKTLELFYAGHTVEQIAKIRKITTRTVLKHLQSFVERGVIDEEMLKYQAKD